MIASMTLGKLVSYPKQNRFAKVLREIDRIERALFMLMSNWLRDPELCCRDCVFRPGVNGYSRRFSG